MELGQHLNGEEAAVAGATLVGATGSNVLRVRKVQYEDVHSQGYEVEISAGDKVLQERKELFAVGSPIAGEHSFEFETNQNLTVRLFENGQALTEYTLSGANSEKFAHLGN